MDPPTSHYGMAHRSLGKAPCARRIPPSVGADLVFSAPTPHGKNRVFLDVSRESGVRFEGQTAIVTGGAQGIGAAVAIALASEGANVVISDINELGIRPVSDTINSLGAGSCLALACDVSDERQVEAMLQRTLEQFGQLDVLVNTAAWLDPAGPVVDLPVDRFQHALDTNLTGVFLCCKHALKVMIPAGKGAIVNVSSINGLRGFPNRASYGASKAAVVNLTETIARECAEQGIRVNAVCPGGVDTPRMPQLMANLAELEGRTREEGLAEYEQRRSTLLQPEQVAALILYLVSAESDKVTGNAVKIGLHIW
jgi:NAD(P)-dependent dehydrogenase (short-subunit alcohol dehydrogenase family)